MKKIHHQHPARDALEKWSRAYPGIWRFVDSVRQRHPRDTAAPPYVFLSLGEAALAMRMWRDVNSVPEPTERQWEPASELKQFASWRPTQGIYRFDPTLYEAIIETPLEGDIPVELLRRLPEWCVYIETPGLAAPLASRGSVPPLLRGAPPSLPLLGMWATLEHVPEPEASTGALRRFEKSIDVLHLGLHTEREIAVNHVPLRGTLESCLELLKEDWVAGYGETAPPSNYVSDAQKLFTPMLSLLLYLCAEAPEIGGGSRSPVRPEPKRTRQGLRLFPADKPMVWDVGVRIGAALRRAYQTENESVTTGRNVRPHVRRAHWHTFLAGPRNEERTRRVKWLPPIPVNLNDLTNLPATIRPVED